MWIGQLNWVNDTQNFTGKNTKNKLNEIRLRAGYWTHSKFLPEEAGYKIWTRIFFLGSMMKTARHVNTMPWAFTSSRSSIFSFSANERLVSSMIGYGNVVSASIFPYVLMSSIHFKCDSTESIERAIGLTFRFSNSGYNWATRDNSVVQTGVKSAGCENKMPHLRRKYGTSPLVFRMIQWKWSYTYDEPNQS